MKRDNVSLRAKTNSLVNSFEIGRLKSDMHGALLCYPGTNLRSFSSRVKQLGKLGVNVIVFEGTSKVGSFGVVGKGCVSIVLKAKIRGIDELVALKCRRVDANRESMKEDYKLQKLANSAGVGPKAISVSNDFFAMEYVDSLKLGKWTQTLKTRSSKKFLKKLIRDSLTQCFLLDKLGLDHGELSNPTKHILIRKDRSGNLVPKTVIIDYESSGTNRKVSNMTSVAQFFFLGGWQSWKIRKILGIEDDKEELLSLLKSYKETPSLRRFENLMAHVNC